MRLALRSLARSPVFLITAVLSLGLAIGAGAAAFSVLDAVRFRALPFRDADRLVLLSEVPAVGPPGGECRGACDVAYETYANVLATHPFQMLDAVAAFTSGGKTLDTGDGPILVTGGVVSPVLFELLGATPLRGRLFTTEEDRLGAPFVTVLSHELWQAHFGSDPSILGVEVKLSDTRYTVVGVMPPGFDFEAGSQFWLPVVPTLDPSTLPSIRSVSVIGRLAPGRTIEQLRAELAGIEPAARARDGVAATRLTAAPLRARYTAATQSHDVILAAIVAVVLLIACANLANLVLVRTLGQQRELAVRAALGAGATRLTRHLLAQNLTLVLVSAAFGLFVAWQLLDVLGSAEALASLRPTGMEYRIDLRVIAFSAALALAAGALLSGGPAWLVARMDVQRVLRESTPAAAGGRWAGRAQRLFVVAQIASAAVLLTGAGLMARTVLNLSQADPGFEHARLIQATPSLPHPWRVEEIYLPLFERMVEEVRRIPGAASVALRAAVPLGTRGEPAEVVLEGAAEPLERTLTPPVSFSVTPAYFSTVGVPVVRGRAFAEHDRRESVAVAIVNEWAARHWWPDDDAVGRRLQVRSPAGAPMTLTVVGVVRDNKAAQGGLLLAEAGPELYRPFDQSPSAFPAMLVRSAADAAGLVRPVRLRLVELVPDRPVFAGLVSDRLDAQLDGVRTNALHILAFAAVGLLLALIGIYGVVSYAVSRRTRELAIRGAIGASRGVLRGLVLRDALRLAAIGVALGLGAAAFATRLIQTLLHGTSSTDAGVYIAVAAVIVALSLAASFIPASRAARVEPLTALKGS